MNLADYLKEVNGLVAQLPVLTLVDEVTGLMARVKFHLVSPNEHFASSFISPRLKFYYSLEKEGDLPAVPWTEMTFDMITHAIDAQFITRVMKHFEAWQAGKEENPLPER